MTYREAKQRLDDWYAGEIVDISPEVLVCCHKAIEKQIPKEVIEFDKYNFKCPCCNVILGIEKEDILIYDMTPPQHCEACGQMLDWDYFN